MSDQRYPKMRRSRLVILFIVMLVMGAVTAGGILMGLELNQRNVTIRHTENELHVTSQELSAQVGRNAELTSVNRNLSASLEDEKTRNAELLSINDGLTNDLASAEAHVIELADDLQGAIDTNADLVSDNESLHHDLRLSEASNKGLRERNGTLTSNLRESVTRANALETELEQVSEKNETLTSNFRESVARANALEMELEQINARYDVLVGVAGDVDQLRAEAGNLEGEIASLRASIAELTTQRAPLILESSIGGFRCTGSMEPKLTCLDTATWLDNFVPEDIVVGTIVSFRPVEECELDSDSVAHRVMDIKNEDGVYYFWPQGDANDEPDGCWIPEGNVDSYIIEVQKNVRPKNETLRNAVNHATSQLDEASISERAAWMAYDRKYIAYCGERTGQTCYLSNSRIQELDRLYAMYSRAYDAYERAFDLWECWQNAARSASYRFEGGAPLYLLCLSPLPPPPNILWPPTP